MFTNTSRAPLSELPLHQFVSQSLACSPSASTDKLLKTPSRSRSRSPSLPASRRNSVSVSPHKQAVLQNHRLVREGSVASPSSASTQPSITAIENGSAQEDVPLLPRRLFGDRSSHLVGSDDSLEASPVLPGSAQGASRFSPHNVKNLAHHSGGRPSTPKGASTTPLNMRQHRPPHTSGPKPTEHVEPSPTTQRMSEPRLATSQRYEQADALSTPSRTRNGAQPPMPAWLPPSAAGNSSKEAGTGSVTPLEQPTQPIPTSTLQSLPKKKHRVSHTEIAIAHEEAGAGPLVSPSPRKMVDYFASADEKAAAPPSAQTRLHSDSMSDRQQSIAALRSLTDLTSKQPIDSLTLAKSGLFLGVVARPLVDWTVYEDPPLSSDTAPSQDHAHVGSDANNLDGTPLLSPAGSSAEFAAPSTPNKENRVPDPSFLVSKAVPIALPDRAHSADAVPTKTRSSSRLASVASSPVAVASRKRGTGGRLSLLADAEDDEAHRDASVQLEGDETLAVAVATSPSSGKKLKSKGNPSPAHSARKVSAHQRKASAGRSLESGRTSRKASSTLSMESPQRALDAAAVDTVASRTRSRTRV
ncbi:hypothetical protein PHSY_004734 [Pseudozyma hubeiensis SY62]|uniref:Uncharacterized protein n=1 Tax=Pseudozyma hubeiensis (strain SY62) TaxID=1305764 RepID=R9P730_PSEHS|nr:hypothetical protein PHSY_004734 [Pseudozyma hubeiensis SY62]GAC97149.1 hypothetical protein PHSY_004734 [Pseudozyma hubeiensis SY62]